VPQRRSSSRPLARRRASRSSRGLVADEVSVPTTRRRAVVGSTRATRRSTRSAADGEAEEPGNPNPSPFSFFYFSFSFSFSFLLPRPRSSGLAGSDAIVGFFLGASLRAGIARVYRVIDPRPENLRLLDLTLELLETYNRA
jgi:hypothetical protein